jgi:hypothetical protein
VSSDSLALVVIGCIALAGALAIALAVVVAYSRGESPFKPRDPCNRQDAPRQQELDDGQ